MNGSGNPSMLPHFPTSWELHLNRARFLLKLARSQAGQAGEADLIMSAVYPCRALYEWLWSEPPEVSPDAALIFASSVRRFKLVEYLRIQDFHRGAITFKNGLVSAHGPMTLTARGSKGFIGMTGFGGKLESIAEGNSNVKMNRPLSINGFAVCDPLTEDMVDVRSALAEYFDDARNFFHSGKHLKQPTSTTA